MTIFRVEGSDGNGPYWSMNDEELEKILPRKADKRHPCPGEDGMPSSWELEGDFYYGFQSLEQLLSWFEEETLNALERDFDYRIAVYDLPDTHAHSKNYIRGYHQVAFRKEIARKVMDL